jgi:hypothetical protein
MEEEKSSKPTVSKKPEVRDENKRFQSKELTRGVK